MNWSSKFKHNPFGIIYGKQDLQVRKHLDVILLIYIVNEVDFFSLKNPK